MSHILLYTPRRYEYRKFHVKGLGPSRLGRDRIEKLNAIGFQWRLRPERVPWDDRFHVRVCLHVRYFIHSYRLRFSSSMHSLQRPSLSHFCVYNSILYSTRRSLNSNIPTAIVVYQCPSPSWANGPNTNVINMSSTCAGSHRR
jgi:hypothetical protein